MDVLAIRLLSQQLAVPQYSKPEEVVSHFGAVQAQEYRLMRWTVAMRTKKPSIGAFETAYNSGRIVRLHLLRGTWHLVAAEDYNWMLKLCGRKGMNVIKGWMKSNGISIPDDEHAMVNDALVQIVGERGCVTCEDIENALAGMNIRMDKHRLSYHIRMAEYEGLLCSGDLHPMKATYSLVSHKIKTEATSDMVHEEMLALLARKYFRSHSPATLEDFVWWSGLSVSECRNAIASLGHELFCETWHGQTFYIHESCRMCRIRTNSIHLLPSYDEYLIGYKSRGYAIPPEFQHRVHSNNGIFFPVIVRDGRVCGNWKPFVKDLQTDYFCDGMTGCGDDVEAWNRYKQYLRQL